MKTEADEQLEQLTDEQLEQLTDEQLEVLAEKVFADSWESGNAFDLGMTESKDLNDPLVYKEVTFLYVISPDSDKFQYEIYRGEERIKKETGYQSWDEAKRAADRAL